VPNAGSNTIAPVSLVNECLLISTLIGNHVYLAH